MSTSPLLTDSLSPAAHFVQTLVDTYESSYASALSSASNSDDPTSESSGGKAASNLLTLLAELYTFQVVSCTLIYGIIRSFLEGGLGELEVELFLKLLKGDPDAIHEWRPRQLKLVL